ncbi:sporulation protein YqfD [Mumia quercus]|uniref:sporulation protein YqfD n=1 Tax=Mumia quercus TaxID=2976125 RepID=UPI0021CFB8FC|nr:sporulation protein YqfD [Mumia quercus]
MHALMRYTVKHDELETHLDLLQDVYRELATTQPDGIAWTTYRVTGTRTFIEVVEGADLPQPLPRLRSFQRYRVGLDDRCEGAREFLEMAPIASFAA